MIKQILDIPITEITDIIHISDVHIRNLKRHKEYREVFEILYEQIKLVMTPTTIIIISGDIAHSKTEMSPELVELMGEFFTNLSELGHVLITAGNHDANLSNKSRLDVISPIIKLMKNKNIFYLKDSGLYSFANVDISVMSVFDKESDYVLADKLSAEYKVAIYHGVVNSSKTDLGFMLDGGIDMNLFDGFHCVILGDIHKNQILQEYSEEEIEIDTKELSIYLKDKWEHIDG